MSLKIDKPLVSAEWLLENLNDDNLVVLNATIPKVIASEKEGLSSEIRQISGAIFFDLKNVFSDEESKYPNTILSPEAFEKKAQSIGINNNSCIVVYDDLGIYSSPRVWWMFQLMGFENIAVLNGGFKEWKARNYPTELKYQEKINIGNFKSKYQVERVKFTTNILENLSHKNYLIIDARSEGRFLGTEPEPRKELESGHIPNSVSLPFSQIIEEGKYLSKNKLETVFNDINPENRDLIFSCGSGITACILALGAEIAGFKNQAVYDGSWTEWASTNGLPIEK